MKNKLSKISHIFLLFLFILPLSSINNIYAQAQESISTTKTEYLTNDDDAAPIVLNNKNDNSEYKWEVSQKYTTDKTKYSYRPTFQARNIEDIQNRIDLNNTECSPEYQEIPNTNTSINPVLSPSSINISNVIYCYRIKIINNNNITYSNVIKIIKYRENKIYNITSNQRLLSNLSQSTNNSQIIIDQQPIYDRFDNKCHYDLLPLEIKAYLSDEDTPEGKGLTYQWQRAIYDYQSNSNENYIDIQGATNKIHIPDIPAAPNLQMYLYRVQILNSNQYIYSDTALRYRCPQDKINEDSNREYIAKLPFLYLTLNPEWKGTENQLKMQLLNNYNTPEEMKNSVYNENLTFDLTIDKQNISIPLRDIIIEGIYYNSFNKYDDQFLIKIKNKEIKWTEDPNTKERSTPTLDAIYERVKENRVGMMRKDKDLISGAPVIDTCVPKKIEIVDTALSVGNLPVFSKYKLCDLPGIDYNILEKNPKYISFLYDLNRKGYWSNSEPFKLTLTDEELKYIKNKLYELQDQIIYEENKKSIIGKTKNLFLKDLKEKYINSTGTITLSKDYHPNGMEDNKIASGTQIEIINTEIIDTGKYNIKNIIILLSFIIFASSLFYLHKKKKINIIKNRKTKIIFSLIILFIILIILIYKTSAQEQLPPIDDPNVINNNTITEIDMYSPTLIRLGIGVTSTLGTHIPIYNPSCCVSEGTTTKEDMALATSQSDINNNIRLLATSYSAPTFSGASSVLGSDTNSSISFTISSSQLFSQYQIDCGLTYSNMTISTGLINILSTNSKVVDLSLFQPNTTYYCKARISNVYSSWSPYSNVITITTRLRLIQPLFTITPWSGEELGIVINKNVGATPFSEYYINCNGSQLVYTNTNTPNILYYTSSYLGLTPNIYHNCYVKIIQPGYDWSLPVYTTFTTSNALAYPNLQINNILSNSIDFTISKRGNINFDEYYIECSSSGHNTISKLYNTTFYIDTDSVNDTLSNLDSNTNYNCKSKIRNTPYSDSNYSNTINITTPNNIPSIVTGFYLPNKATSDNNVSLRWNLSSVNENVTNYNIQYATNSSFTNITNINTNSGNTNTKIITGLTNNTQYAFRIRAQNNIGFSEWGNVVVYATPSYPEYTNNSPDYWNRTAINVDNAYNSLTTTEKNNLSNIVVGVIDSGIDIFHPDFWDDIDNDCPVWAFTNNIRNMDNYVNSRDALANCDFTNSSIYKNEGESGDTKLYKNWFGNCVLETSNNWYRKETNGCDDDGNGYIDDTFGANFGSNNSSGNNYLRVDHIGIDGELNGHGSSVSSIISARKNNNKGIIGVAPNVKIFSVRAVGVSNSNILLDRTIDDLLVSKGIKIINRSYGGYLELDALGTMTQSINWHKELNNNNKKDILSIVANNNHNQNLSTRKIVSDINTYAGFGYPNIHNESINVGATNNTSNNIKDFSNYGNRTDIVAPGDCMLTNYASNLYQNNLIRYRSCNQKNDVYYQMIFGTSFSAPHITGVVALIKAVNPDLTREQVRQILHKSGTDIGSNNGSKPSYQGVNANCIYRVGFDDCSGYGLINTYTAVQLARAEKYYPEVITPFIYSPRTGDTLSDINSASSSIIISIDNAPNIQSYKISIQKNATGTNYDNIIPATNTQWIDVKTDNTIRNALSLSTTTIDISTIQNGLESGLYTMRIQAINWNGDTFEHYVSGVKIEKVNQCRVSLSVRYNSVNTCNSATSTSTISGSISYFSSTSIPISEAKISLTNTDNNTLVSTTTTNNTGAYTFNNVPTGGNYNISVSYTYSSSVNGININDNVRNAQIIVGTYTPTDDAKISADTNQDGIIDINDNVKNAQIIVGTYILPIPFIFIPTDKTNLNATSTENSITKKNYLWPSYQSKTINNLNSNQIINFKGYKIGDSNGDWR